MSERTHLVMRGVMSALLSVAVASVAVCAGAEGEHTTTTVEEGIPPIILQDASGKPLAGAQAAVVHKDKRSYAFGLPQSGADGTIRFKNSDYHSSGWNEELVAGEYELLVLAPGKAPLVRALELPSKEPVRVTPVDGKEVEVTVLSADNQPLPEGVVPRFYPQSFAFAAWPRNPEIALDSTWPEPLGNGRFNIELDETTSAPWRMLIHDPEVARGFEEFIETTSAIAMGKLSVKLPPTGTLSLGLTVPEKWKASAHSKDFGLSAMRMVDAGSENRMYFEIARSTDLSETKTTATFTNAVPGNYWTQTYELNTKTMEPLMTPDAYSKGARLEVKPGELASVAFTYLDFDPENYKGPGVADITVLKQDGSPAAGLAVKIATYDEELSREVTLTSGTFSDAGTTRITGLKTPGAYEVSLVEDRNVRIGSVSFKGDNKATSVSLTIPPRAGDLAPDITLVDVETSESVQLSDFRGQVVFLDFWATWCGPCQAPMEHNQQLMTENADRWNGKAVIVGASLDDLRETVAKHVKAKGWTAVRQLWGGESEPGQPSDQQKLYGITSVPTCLLIDADGKIVKRGHPAMFDVEKEIDALIESP